MTSIALGIPGIRRAPDARPDTTGRPETDALVDRFGRIARDLRVSITEKCSLRCTYCMPEQGLPAIARKDLLTPDEIARLVEIGARDLGVTDVRFTGGEPLMRADLAEILAKSSAVARGASISLTTNGIGLDKRIDELIAAGLTRINVSLDTVDRDHFARLTRRDRLPAVFAGIDAAKRAGLTPLKINAVLMRDTLAGSADLLAWSLANGVKLRFIEQMPLDADEAWARDNMVDAAELLDVLGSRFTLTEPHRDDPSSPAEEWLVDGGPATVGIIASVTRAFCAACDRTRLTAEGTVRSCLFGDDETDLRGMLRGGADDSEIADRWRAAMWGKQAGHGMASADFVRPTRSMGAIGG
ncbi:cyclic pyranopterin monophosphate synthase subunit MoaA [Labedella gwakjiensis]|uniref:GTP 3',8-cyclase n=1 Tax=Labedella gwakjiensis TaxID=390269 RepID=A0A2P8GZ62_9MICO|nr:GTP 3',8-cyclase MoaA [Labedella gwakjiensis]PSL39247.1 cyclic pyranopterin monophosphate synthase subunit MoaA [Labedella gwakjiensis]RUQ86329.1 GTP 3',8-cyclase MoaA [Labedella gwakjiensis]